MNIVTANRLLDYRKKNNLSQEELAEKIGVSRQAVSKWERAEASPDTDNLIKLAEIYGVSLDELIKGENEKTEKADFPQPDENTNYVEHERVSFKKGIHVHSKDGEKVDVSFRNGVHVESKDGSRVHVGFDGVYVHDGEKVRAYTDENGHVMVDEELEHRRHRKKVANLIPMWAIALAAFAAFPAADAFLAYPVLCVAFQMIAGFLFGGWAWSWIAYLTIPVYYGICTVIKKGEE